MAETVAATDLPERVDAIVVGSGAAGSNMAARLAEGGKKVLILEAGPARSAGDLVSSTLYARRVKWNGPPVIRIRQASLGHGFNAGFGVGGAPCITTPSGRACMPKTSTMRSRHGRGFDWPLSYDDLAPYYDQVQIEAGVSGDAQQEIWRPRGAPYPMPPGPRVSAGAGDCAGIRKSRQTRRAAAARRHHDDLQRSRRLHLGWLV